MFKQGLTQKFPETNGIRWFNVAVLTLTPAVACYGLLRAPCYRETVTFSVGYYVFSMLGEKSHMELCVGF
jgi:stearoyl-CoA desaturase (delta-9 desaturase)